jgi:hypothetical protein
MPSLFVLDRAKTKIAPLLAIRNIGAELREGLKTLAY